MDYTVGFLFFHFFGDFTMALKQKDVFFELDSVIAEDFIRNSHEIRASGLKLTKTGKAYCFIRPGFLQEALELVQLLWERRSLEVQTKQAYA